MKTLAVLAAVAATVLNAAPAEAAAAPQTFKNQQTGHCLDDSFEFGARPFPCNGLNYQKWRILVENDYRSLQNVHTGRCLGADFDGRVSAGECQTSFDARWLVKRWADNTLELKVVSHTLCLGDYGPLQVRACDASRRQSWF